MVPSPLVSIAAINELADELPDWLEPAPAYLLRKLDISLLLIEPLPFVSIEANNCCSVCEIFELPAVLELQ
jgi:hypothetical protein